METLAADLRFMQRTPLLPEHVEAMRGLGQEISFCEGELVAKTGERMDRFYYLLEGEIEVLDPLTGERYLSNSLGPNQFVGEISFLNGGAYSMSMRAAADTRVIAVERTAMLDLMSRVPEMSDIIISVFAARRRRQLDDSDSSLVLIGGESDPDIRRIASFAGRKKIPFKAFDLQLETPSATTTADDHALDLSKPAVVFGGREVVDDPTPLKVAKLLGLDLEVEDDEVFDVIIVGGGPAGVAAAVYAGAEGLSALVIEDLAVGGQAGTSSRIENYMGFPTGISGADLVWRGEIQAMKFGTRFAMPRRVQSASQTADGLFQVTLEDDGCRVCARSLVVATGVQYRRLPLPKLAQLEGAGIYYAATEIEARYCRGTEVIVVGGGNSAGQAAM